MTSQGSARSRFARAVQTRNAFLAEVALREMGNPTLLEALEYLDLLAEGKAPKVEAAAIRWHGRFELETVTLSIAESQLALGALAALCAGEPEAVAILRGLLRRAQPSRVGRFG
jgi:hypothetical protein